MKTVLILALIAAVCTCSAAKVGKESKEGGCNPMLPQKPSDGQENVSGGCWIKMMRRLLNLVRNVEEMRLDCRRW
jgi:hypothetical protein